MFIQPKTPMSGAQSRPSTRRTSLASAIASPTEESVLARMTTDAQPISGTADLCEIVCVDQEKVARALRLAPARATLSTLAEMFRALGDPTRLRILTALSHEELCVCDLATLTDVSESAVSHSLRTLRQLRLVRYRKAGRIAYYSLDDEHVGRLISEGLIHVGESPRAPVTTAVSR